MTPVNTRRILAQWNKPLNKTHYKFRDKEYGSAVDDILSQQAQNIN
jgi:hypothetical protein